MCLCLGDVSQLPVDRKCVLTPEAAPQVTQVHSLSEGRGSRVQRIRPVLLQLELGPGDVSHKEVCSLPAPVSGSSLCPLSLLLCCETSVGFRIWAIKCGTEGLQAAVQPRRHMNCSLYAVVSAALFLADLAPLVICSHFHTGDGGGRRGSEETRKRDA